MSNNKISIILAIIGVVIAIAVPVFISINKDYNNKIYNSTIDKIVIASKKCYLEEKCNEEKTTLKKLYELKYLDKVINPITKEYFNEESYVEMKNNNYKFYKK